MLIAKFALIPSMLNPLKTSASPGILVISRATYMRKADFRKSNVATQEVANTAIFLLSSPSNELMDKALWSMRDGPNYFDSEVVRLAMRPEK